MIIGRILLQEEEFKIEYEYFLDFLNESLILAKELQNILNEILYKYSKLDRINAYGLRNIENNLYYMDSFVDNLEEMIEKTKNVIVDEFIVFDNLEAKINNDIITFPLDKENDIYVYSDETIGDIWDYKNNL